MSATELLKLSGRKKGKVEVLLYSTGEWFNNTRGGNSNILLSYECKDAKGYSVTVKFFLMNTKARTPADMALSDECQNKFGQFFKGGTWVNLKGVTASSSDKDHGEEFFLAYWVRGPGDIQTTCDFMNVVSNTSNLPEMDNSTGVKLKWHNNTVVAFDYDGSTPTNTSTPSTQVSASHVYNPSTSSQVFNDSVDVSIVEEQLIAGLKMRDYFHGEESWSLTNVENIIVTTHSILTDKFEDPYDKKHNKAKKKILVGLEKRVRSFVDDEPSTESK